VKSVLFQQVWLGLSLLATWLVLSLPVTFLGDGASVGWLAIAAVVCFLPGCLVLILQPVWKSAGVIGFGALSGMLFRMVFVVVAMLAVSVIRRDMSFVFGAGLSIFYLVALGVETLFVVQDLDRMASRSI
jgi:hypothetical protein